jgi:hypothetical protein
MVSGSGVNAALLNCANYNYQRCRLSFTGMGSGYRHTADRDVFLLTPMRDERVFVGAGFTPARVF